MKDEDEYTAGQKAGELNAVESFEKALHNYLSSYTTNRTQRLTIAAILKKMWHGLISDKARKVVQKMEEELHRE